jgi:hypothetical protein
VARPTKLTPQVSERILSALRAGNYRKASALSAGISEQTFHRWMKRGEEAKSGIHRDFCEAVKRAEADAEVHAVAVLRKEIAGGDWRAAIAYLERRHADGWRRQQTIEHDASHTLLVRTEDLADPDLRKGLREITKGMASAREAGADGPGDAD